MFELIEGAIVKDHLTQVGASTWYLRMSDYLKYLKVNPEKDELTMRLQNGKLTIEKNK